MPIARKPQTKTAITQTYSTTATTMSNLTSSALTNANGTGDTTIADVTATPTQTLINNNFRDVSDQINALRNDLINVKGVLNTVVDILQQMDVAT